MKVWVFVLALVLEASASVLGDSGALATTVEPSAGAVASLAQEASDLDCEDFESQEDAQAALAEDPADPNNLDPNGDGIACALLPAASDLDPARRDTADVEVEQDAGDGSQSREARRQARQAGRQGNQDDVQAEAALTCADFATAADAQAAFDADPVGLADLDGDANGIACEELLDVEPVAEEPTRAERRDQRNQDEEPTDEIVIDEPAQPSVREDIDCIDFAFQEEAQQVYNQDVSDPYNLDPNGDGFACSSLPSSDPVVSQVPRTGAGTENRFVAGAVFVATLLAGLCAVALALRRGELRA